MTSLVLGAGYQVPNHSVNSSALATAYIANAHGADSAFFNPSNMVYNQDNHEIETTLSYIYLSSMNYKPNNSTSKIKTKEQHVIIPSIHYVSNKLTESGIRLGLSIVTPYGLTREWQDQPAMQTAKKFSLQTNEINPSIAIPINDKFSIAFGLRYIIASGEVELDYAPLAPVSVAMQGDTTGLGYNLALSYKASKNIHVSATYRSNIMLNLEGDAALQHPHPLIPATSSASLEVALPDNLILAAAYTLHKTTFEMSFDTTFWSRVKENNFEYANTTAEATFGTSSPKLWHDTHAYRLGITHALNNTVTLMLGTAYSTHASDEKYVSFSSPEADSITYACGTKYQFSDKIKIGLALLYADYENRTSMNNEVKGTMSNKDALTVSIGASYKF